MRTHDTENQISQVSIGRLAVCFSVLLICNSVGAEECLLAKQLRDPIIRADYQTVIAASQTADAVSDVEEMYASIQNANFRELPTRSAHNGNRILDPISMECITCHDGTLGRSVNYKVKGAVPFTASGLDTITGSHPVGMDYAKLRMNRAFVPGELLPENMPLMSGRVSCVTCHDMMSNNKAYLAVDLDKSALCFKCHNK